MSPEDLKNAKVRLIKQSDMRRCPHFIMMPSHYREDGTCRCDDPDHTEMKEWGYVWEARWVAPKEEESNE